MAHYDAFYENVTADTIEEGITRAEYRIAKYKTRVLMMEEDLNRFTLSDTSVGALQNTKEMDESLIKAIQESIDKMNKLLDRVLNGEDVTYEEFLNVR